MEDGVSHSLGVIQIFGDAVSGYLPTFYLTCLAQLSGCLFFCLYRQNSYLFAERRGSYLGNGEDLTELTGIFIEGFFGKMQVILL